MSKITAKVIRTVTVTSEIDAVIYVPDDEHLSRAELEKELVKSVRKSKDFHFVRESTKFDVVNLKDNNQPTLPIF